MLLQATLALSLVISSFSILRYAVAFPYFCSDAPITCPQFNLVWNSVVHSPSSVIRDLRYGNVSTCSSCSFWMSMRHAMPSLAVTLVLSTLISRLHLRLTRSKRSTNSCSSASEVANSFIAKVRDHHASTVENALNYQCTATCVTCPSSSSTANHWFTTKWYLSFVWTSRTTTKLRYQPPNLPLPQLSCQMRM